jgi:methylenetetrahydrofolate reductase (NADPH)
MDKPPNTPADDRAQFEVLPLGRSEEEAAALPQSVRLTVTCSPKRGPDQSVEVATRLRALGHVATVHMAARMVRDRAHLDTMLAKMAEAGVDDVFVIGGDVDHALGAYPSAVELLPVIAEHPRRPRMIGIAGYPEGHPQIESETLNQALEEKSRLADYVTTQLWFDPDALRAWVVGRRDSGMTLPVWIGMPGKVSRRRLLDMSLRVGVGPSLKFLRKQRGLRNLFGRSAPDRLFDALVSCRDDPQLNIAGFHYYTFNQLLDTWRWQQKKDNTSTGRESTADSRPASGYVHPEESMT